jgi:small conductance mechanosensitive channel
MHPLLPAAGPVDEVNDTAASWFDWLVGDPLQATVTVLAGMLAIVIARWLITRVVRSVVAGGSTVRRGARRLVRRTPVSGIIPESDTLAVARRVQRAETIASVLRSSAAVVIAIVVLTVIANIYSWNLGPLLASAGVAGVALGFGAQTLVKDVISGLFLLVEDQFGVGDVIDVGEVAGSVEAVGLRVTQIRDLSGTLWYVRNGEVLRVGNMTQGWSKARVEVLVAPNEDIARALDLLRAAAGDLAEDPDVGPLLLAEPEVTGFEDLTAESVRLRLMIKVAPAKQWLVQRELRARIVQRFKGEGIALALPRREVQVERLAFGNPPPDAEPATEA